MSEYHHNEILNNSRQGALDTLLKEIATRYFFQKGESGTEIRQLKYNFECMHGPLSQKELDIIDSVTIQAHHQGIDRREEIELDAQ